MAARQKDSRKFWSFFKEKKSVVSNVDKSELFFHFRSLFDIDSCNMNIYDIDYYLNDRHISPQDNSILNSDISLNEVITVIESLKLGKASGIDGVPPEAVKFAPPRFHELVYRLFQRCFSSGVYPTAWQTGMINPVYKKGCLRDPSNYRPISLLCVLNKLFTKLLANRLTNWLDDRKILSNAQAGFRPSYSTIDSCFVLSTAVDIALSKPRGKLFTAFIDFKSAFDCVDRGILFHKLFKLGIGGNFFNTLLSMYKNINACVKYDDGISTIFHCSKGVRQGCNLSPLLFSLFINDIEDCLVKSHYRGIRINGMNICCLMYADDMVILSDDALCLQGLLSTLENYCNYNKLMLNLDKTKTMVFRKGGHLAREHKWFFKGNQLQTVNNYNYLGLEFSTKGSWNKAQDNLCISAKKALFSLKKILTKLVDIPVSSSMHIFDTKILPILLYGADIWGHDHNVTTSRVYTGFHKYLLGLPTNCVNLVALGELGRPSFHVHSIMKLIHGWLRFLKHSDQRFTSHCYKEQFRLSDSFTKSWGCSVKTVLCSMGFSFVWMNQGVEDEHSFLKSFRQRLLDIDAQNWSAEVHSKNSLRTYCRFKNNNYIEPYVLCLNKFLFRTILAKFRCGALRIGVNSGRSNNIPVEQRTCTFCNSGDIDDEFHFLLSCSFLADLRSNYIPAYYFNPPNLLKFADLLSSSSYEICKNVSYFINHAMKLRNMTPQI